MLQPPDAVTDRGLNHVVPQRGARIRGVVLQPLRGALAWLKHSVTPRTCLMQRCSGAHACCVVCVPCAQTDSQIKVVCNRDCMVQQGCQASPTSSGWMITPGSLTPGEDGREAGTHVRSPVPHADAAVPARSHVTPPAVLLLCAPAADHLGTARRHRRALLYLHAAGAELRH